MLGDWNRMKKNDFHFISRDSNNKDTPLTLLYITNTVLSSWVLNGYSFAFKFLRFKQAGYDVTRTMLLHVKRRERVTEINVTFRTLLHDNKMATPW